MTIGEFMRAFERRVPVAAKYNDDNIGLQCGDSRAALAGVLVAYEMDARIVEEAARKKLNLIVCYHPLLHAPLLRVVRGEAAGDIVLRAAERKINIYVAHTNFDSIPDGTNFLLAERLGLRVSGFLAPLGGSLVKIAVFVPAAHVERVSKAMWDAGAGGIGEYENCSFRSEGVGTFFGGAAASPAVGRKLRLERVEEVRVEMIAPRWRVRAALDAMRAVHPYEEIAYDVVPLENENTAFGMGVVGEFPVARSLGAAVRLVKRRCGIPAVRAAGNMRGAVKRVALVGGSGGGFLERAIEARADLFITGDVRYHTFRAAAGRIALIDAGHAETERFVAGGLAALVRDVLHSSKNSHIRVVKTMINSNPIIYA